MCALTRSISNYDNTVYQNGLFSTHFPLSVLIRGAFLLVLLPWRQGPRQRRGQTPGPVAGVGRSPDIVAGAEPAQHGIRISPTYLPVRNS